MCPTRVCKGESEASFNLNLPLPSICIKTIINIMISCRPLAAARVLFPRYAPFTLLLPLDVQQPFTHRHMAIVDAKEIVGKMLVCAFNSSPMLRALRIIIRLDIASLRARTAVRVLMRCRCHHFHFFLFGCVFSCFVYCGFRQG